MLNPRILDDDLKSSLPNKDYLIFGFVFCLFAISIVRLFLLLFVQRQCVKGNEQIYEYVEWFGLVWFGFMAYPYLPTPPLGQDMTHGQFLNGV